MGAANFTCAEIRAQYRADAASGVARISARLIRPTLARAADGWCAMTQSHAAYPVADWDGFPLWGGIVGTSPNPFRAAGGAA